jgi:hypothetical protein
MLRRVALVGTDVSEQFIASISRVTRIGEVLTTLVVLATEEIFEECRLLGCYAVWLL